MAVAMCPEDTLWYYLRTRTPLNESESEPMTCINTKLNVNRWGFKSPLGHFSDLRKHQLFESQGHTRTQSETR